MTKRSNSSAKGQVTADTARQQHAPSRQRAFCFVIRSFVIRTLIRHSSFVIRISPYTPPMISALTGTLRHVQEDRAHLAVGPVLYELLIPAADHAELQSTLGEELTFHTIFYLQGDA